MLSKNKIKYIKSLKIRKYRKIENAFVCEGKKIFGALVSSNFEIINVYATCDFIRKNGDKYRNVNFDEVGEE